MEGNIPGMAKVNAGLSQQEMFGCVSQLGQAWEVSFKGRGAIYYRGLSLYEMSALLTWEPPKLLLSDTMSQCPPHILPIPCPSLVSVINAMAKGDLRRKGFIQLPREAKGGHGG